MRTVAEDLLQHGGDEKVDLLSELIDERDRFECFLTIASRLAEPMINSGDNSMLFSLSEAGVAAILFDTLFDNDYPEIGAELAESKQWFKALFHYQQIYLKPDTGGSTKQKKWL